MSIEVAMIVRRYGSQRMTANRRQLITADLVPDHNRRADVPQLPFGRLQLRRNDHNHKHAAVPQADPGRIPHGPLWVVRRIQDHHCGRRVDHVLRRPETAHRHIAAGEAMLQPRRPPRTGFPHGNLLRRLPTRLRDADCHASILEPDTGP